MLKIAVCDDEVGFTSKMEALIEKAARQKGIVVEVDVFFDGVTLFKNIQNNSIRYDMIFLDIEMGALNGLETARQIRKLDELVFLIYVTSHQNYAVEAYEVHPFAFLVKPLREEQVLQNFFRIYKKISSGAFYYEYRFKREYYRVIVNDIMYFESNKRVIHIHMRDGAVHTYYGKLNEVQKELEHKKVDFFRIHRSILVNVRYVKCKAYDHVVLSDDSVFFISEDRRRDINMQYMGMLEKEMM